MTRTFLSAAGMSAISTAPPRPLSCSCKRPPTKIGSHPAPEIGHWGSGRRGARSRLSSVTWKTRVELRGFEPLTPSMRTRCATGLRYSPENLSQRSKPQA